MMDTYALPLRLLHWLIAVLILALVLMGFALEFHAGPRALHAPVVFLHVGLGLSVLALMVPRLILRLTTRLPPLPAAIPPAERAAAHLGHAGLYALAFALPVSGVIFEQAHGKAVTWFGAFTLPAVCAVSPPLHRVFSTLHLLGGWALAALIIVHIAALAVHRRQGVRLLPRMRL